MCAFLKCDLLSNNLAPIPSYTSVLIIFAFLPSSFGFLSCNQWIFMRHMRSPDTITSSSLLLDVYLISVPVLSVLSSTTPSMSLCQAMRLSLPGVLVFNSCVDSNPLQHSCPHYPYLPECYPLFIHPSFHPSPCLSPFYASDDSPCCCHECCFEILNLLFLSLQSLPVLSF